MVTPPDQSRRFQALVWNHPAAAVRQVARLDPGERTLAQARLALRRDDLSAETRIAAIPAAELTDPGLVLDRAAWLRRRNRLGDARQVWLASGEAAQRNAPDEHRLAYWTERNLLVRRLLRSGDDAGAYAVAALPGQTAAEPTAAAEFLAGFIALRRLHDPAAAIRHFETLASVSNAAITQARAHYWLGRAATEAGRPAAAEYGLASAWPTTFYGQLAALALDPDPAALTTRLRAAHDPAWTRDEALDFGGGELIRAAGLLNAWGDPGPARAFLLRADEQASVPSQRALAAHLATGLGLPDVAVAIARRMGRDGLMLPDAGWPTPVQPPLDRGPDRAAVLALMRQESSFDPQAVSPSGALGLMQLMPATAQAVARQLAVPTSPAALTGDGSHNMRLGTAYLAAMMEQFGGSLPLAFAAYNAGPHRVAEWLAENGDPREDATRMIDWIELIPFDETRNYVQRVLENVVMYRARSGEAPLRLATWSR